MPTIDSRGCVECSRADAISRRAVFRAALAGLGTVAFGSVIRQVSYGATAEVANVLVVLSLRGGADGLSMVVPHGDSDYYAARPRIAVPASALLESDSTFGLHPAFAPLRAMWRAQTFGAVHAVGLPQPNRSHFDAMERIEQSDPGSDARQGWINKMAGLTANAGLLSAAQLGTAVLPASLYGDYPAVAAAQAKSLRLDGILGSPGYDRRRQSLQQTWQGSEGPLGEWGRAALAVSDRMSALDPSSPPQNGATYPQGDLGACLADTVRMIRSEAGACAITVDHGGWDLHTNLGTSTNGPMRDQLDELATALAAFFTDLGALADRVTVVTVSEFGRRVSENGNSGLDHGYGNCILLLGAGVRGGSVYGRWPGLADDRLTSGDLAVTLDHRSVLAEVIESRFPEVPTDSVFPGFVREPIGVMR